MITNMKKTYIQPLSQEFLPTYQAEMMAPNGTHSIDPYQEKGTMNIGGDDGDVDGYETPNSLSPSLTKERILWSDGEPGANSISRGLW